MAVEDKSGGSRGHRVTRVTGRILRGRPHLGEDQWSQAGHRPPAPDLRKGRFHGLRCTHHAAVLLTFGLLAGCGGDRARAGTGTDTTGAAAAHPRLGGNARGRQRPRDRDRQPRGDSSRGSTRRRAPRHGDQALSAPRSPARHNGRAPGRHRTGHDSRGRAVTEADRRASPKPRPHPRDASSAGSPSRRQQRPRRERAGHLDAAENDGTPLTRRVPSGAAGYGQRRRCTTGGSSST